MGSLVPPSQQLVSPFLVRRILDEVDDIVIHLEITKVTVLLPPLTFGRDCEACLGHLSEGQQSTAESLPEYIYIQYVRLGL